MQPAPQGLDGGSLPPQLIRELAELIHLVAIDRLEQRFASRKVAVERSDADASALGHGFEAGVRAAGAEDRGGRLQETLAIADRVGAGPARGLSGMIWHIA